MATMAFQPPSPSASAQIASSWSRASSGSIATIGRCVRSSRSPSGCFDTRCASSIASCANSWRRPCLWIAIRLKLRGANGSPSTASTRAVTRGGRPVTSHSTRSPASASLRSEMANSRRSRLSTGDSQKRSPSRRTTPSTSSADLASFFIGCAIQRSPCCSVRARTRSPMPSATRLPRSCRRMRGGGVSACHCSGTPEDVAAVVDLDDPQHRHLRHAARLVESAAGRAVDQPLVRHVLEQALEVDLVLRRDRPNARAISRLPAGWSDEAMKSRICLRLGRPAGRLRGMVLLLRHAELVSASIPETDTALHGNGP